MGKAQCGQQAESRSEEKARLGWVSLNNFSRFLPIGVVPSYPVSGSGLIKARNIASCGMGTR